LSARTLVFFFIYPRGTPTTAPPRPQVVFVLDDAISGDRPRAPPLPVSFDVFDVFVLVDCFRVLLIRRRLDVARRRSRSFSSSSLRFFLTCARAAMRTITIVDDFANAVVAANV